MKKHDAIIDAGKTRVRIDQETGKVSVRSRFAGDEGQKDLKDFISAICEEIRTKEIRQEVEE